MDSKAWYMSKGVWGGIIAIGAAIAGAFGYAVSPDDQAGLAEAAVAVGAAVGGAIAIIGRAKASKPLK